MEKQPTINSVGPSRSKFIQCPGYLILFCFHKSSFKYVFKKVQSEQQKQPPEVFHKKGVLRNFAKFTGKRLCQSLFFKKVAG